MNTLTVKPGRERQTRYLSQALQLEETVNPSIVMATLTIVCLAIAAFILWAGVTNIKEVARAPGEVIPRGHQQTVQHLEGGLIKKIYVKEGDIVEQEQVLVVLDDASIREDLERAESKQLSLAMQAEKMRAYLEGRSPDFTRFGDASPDMIAEQTQSFAGMQTAQGKEAQIIAGQIEQKKHLIATIRADLATARGNYRIVDDIYQRRASLNARGYASDMQTLEDKKRLNEVGGHIRHLETQIAVANSELKEFEARLESLGAGSRDQTHQKLDQNLAEQRQNIEIIDKLKERIGRLEIRSPVQGVVKGLSVNTIGAVVHPGQTLMEIVPVSKDLEVQIKISPKDIGHIVPGQQVRLKFSTYDFSRYGAVEGRLERISATTFTGENGERYYQGAVHLDKEFVGASPANVIMPGMTVMADVITGDKTILQYLLRPVEASLQTAFTER